MGKTPTKQARVTIEEGLKKNDFVTCKNEENYNLTAGKMYRVAEDQFGRHVIIINDDGRECTYRAELFEKVHIEPEYKTLEQEIAQQELENIETDGRAEVSHEMMAKLLDGSEEVIIGPLPELQQEALDTIKSILQQHREGDNEGDLPTVADYLAQAVYKEQLKEYKKQTDPGYQHEHSLFHHLSEAWGPFSYDEYIKRPDDLRINHTNAKVTIAGCYMNAEPGHEVLGWMNGNGMMWYPDGKISQGTTTPYDLYMRVDEEYVFMNDAGKELGQFHEMKWPSLEMAILNRKSDSTAVTKFTYANNQLIDLSIVYVYPNPISEEASI